jgi:hypothetical protein
MKLADRVVEIHSAGVQNASGFTIAQTSKMFKILSDSLYSDKVMAVVRELSTNAYDSHIAAGNKNPFKVTLPTQANPSFIVRDYGTGLSQEDMENLYTTYGASNKNDSNDFVGCLGLGSKSPFAYTKSFTTTSYYNGKAYAYIAAMDDNGVPSLNLFGVTDTKEPNGLEIKFAVKQHDFTEFSTKAKRVFHYFRLKPIIDGGVCPSLNDNTYSHHNVVIEGKGWKIGRVSSDWTKYPSGHNSPGSGVVAIMGNIAYPVDASKIVGEDRPDQPDHIQAWNRAFRKADVDNWKNLVREILNQGLYLEIQFGIGELEMDVSREGLQYTKQVINALREKTQDIYLQLKEDMTGKLAGSTSLVEAYQTYYNLSDIAGGWTAGASWTDPNGKVHDLVSGSDLEYKFKKSKQLYVFNFRTAGYRSRRMVYLTDKIHHETLSGRGSYYWDANNRKSGKMVFFRCDLKGAETAKKIVTKYCNQNNSFAYLMVDSDTPEDSTEGFDDIIRDIGGESHVVLVSEHKSLIANTNRNKGTRDPLGSVSSDSIFLVHGDIKSAGSITGTNSMNDSSYLKEITDQSERDSVLDEDTIVYIPIIRYASVGDCPAIKDIHNMLKDKECVDLAKELFGTTKIFAIKESYANKLIKDGYNLVIFNDFFKDSLQKLYDKTFKDLSGYNGLIEHAKNEYNKKENTGNSYHYYNSYPVDQNFLWHILNIFGLDYANYVDDKDMVGLIDKCMAIEFFANTIHKTGFDIAKFKQADYFAHMTKILHNMGINGLNSKDIRNANVSYNRLVYWIKNLYINRDDMLKSIKPDDSLKGKLPSITDLRKEIKESLDKQPILKYIVCSGDSQGNLRDLKSNNPLNAILSRNYYGRSDSAWSGKLDDVESFRQSVSDSIK